MILLYSIRKNNLMIFGFASSLRFLSTVQASQSSELILLIMREDKCSVISSHCAGRCPSVCIKEKYIKCKRTCQPKQQRRFTTFRLIIFFRAFPSIYGQIKSPPTIFLQRADRIIFVLQKQRCARVMPV